MYNYIPNENIRYICIDSSSDGKYSLRNVFVNTRFPIKLRNVTKEQNEMNLKH